MVLFCFARFGKIKFESFLEFLLWPVLGVKGLKSVHIWGLLVPLQGHLNPPPPPTKGESVRCVLYFSSLLAWLSKMESHKFPRESAPVHRDSLDLLIINKAFTAYLKHLLRRSP